MTKENIEYKIQQCNNFGITKKGLLISHEGEEFDIEEEAPAFRKALAKEYIDRWMNFGGITHREYVRLYLKEYEQSLKEAENDPEYQNELKLWSVCDSDGLEEE